MRRGLAVNERAVGQPPEPRPSASFEMARRARTGEGGGIGSQCCSFFRTWRMIADTVGEKGGPAMLWTIFVILLIMWLLGMVSSYTMGGFIHILLIVAIVVVLIRVIQGRNPV